MKIEEFENGKYQGQFKNEKRQGFGIYTWKNGNVYEGEWVDGGKNGLGISTSFKLGYYEA